MSWFAIATGIPSLLLIALTAVSYATCEPRPNAGQTIKVEGRIDRVIALGSEPVFRASGYTFRVIPAPDVPTTDVRFGKGMQSLSEVGPNTWAIFEGKLDTTPESDHATAIAPASSAFATASAQRCFGLRLSSSVSNRTQ